MEVEVGRLGWGVFVLISVLPCLAGASFVYHTAAGPQRLAGIEADGLLSIVDRRTRWGCGARARDCSPQVAGCDRGLPFVCCPTGAAHRNTDSFENMSSDSKQKNISRFVLYFPEITPKGCAA